MLLTILAFNITGKFINVDIYVHIIISYWCYIVVSVRYKL